MPAATHRADNRSPPLLPKSLNSLLAAYTVIVARRTPLTARVQQGVCITSASEHHETQTARCRADLLRDREPVAFSGAAAIIRHYLVLDSIQECLTILHDQTSIAELHKNYEEKENE